MYNWNALHWKTTFFDVMSRSAWRPRPDASSANLWAAVGTRMNVTKKNHVTEIITVVQRFIPHGPISNPTRHAHPDVPR